jgi:hypothetical protein
LGYEHLHLFFQYLLSPYFPCFYPVWKCFSFFFQESILELSSPMQENIARTSFLGAASASKGKRLDLSDRVCRLDSSAPNFLYYIC